MNKLKKTLLVIGVIVGALITLCLIAFSVLTSSLCGTEVVREYKSPTGKQSIIHTVKNCGATTDFVTSLNLKSTNGKIISIKGAHENDLYVQWIDDKNLTVNYAGDATKIYSYKTNVSGINIKYKTDEDYLEIKCLYYECEEQNRQLEIQRRKEWCGLSPEKKTDCVSKPGWETCSDGLPCIYSGPNR